jgi:hypothetical protein
MNTQSERSDMVDIRLEISERGIDRAVVAAADDAEQAAAHLLLARITPELRRLDNAIRTKKS